MADKPGLMDLLLPLEILAKAGFGVVTNLELL
jgi:hypothetical protein